MCVHLGVEYEGTEMLGAMGPECRWDGMVDATVLSRGCHSARSSWCLLLDVMVLR